LLAGFALSVNGVLATADQIPHGLIIFLRDVDRCHFPGAVQPCQIAGIAPVGLDPIPAAPRDHGRSNDIAVKTLGSQVPIDLIAAGTRFVDEAQLGSGCAQFADHFVQRVQIASDAALQPNFTAAALIGQGHFDGVFVCIKSNECDTLSHDLPPWLWLCMGLFLIPI